MKQKQYPVVLSPVDVSALNRFITTGTHKAREIIRARILLLAHEDKSNAGIVDAVGCSAWTARNVRKRFVVRGSWQAAVADAPKSGQPKKLTGQHEAFITAKACTDPPAGHAHWTVPELKRELLEGYTDIRSISDETVRKVLLDAKLQPWREKNVVHPETHARISGTHGRHHQAVYRTVAGRP